MKGSVFLPDAVHPLHLLMTSTDRVGLSNTPLIGQSCPWNPARKELEPITALSTHEIINDEFLWLVLGREILFHMWPAYVWPADPQFTWQIRQAIPIMHWLRAKYILGAPSQPWIGTRSFHSRQLCERHSCLSKRRSLFIFQLLASCIYLAIF